MAEFQVRVFVPAINEDVTLSAPDAAAAEEIALTNAMSRAKEKAVVTATPVEGPVPAGGVETDHTPRA